MEMKHFIPAVFIVGIFALSATDGYACSCSMPEVPQAFDDARAVFVGEVIDIAKPRTNDPKAPPADRLYEVKFKVERYWKGVWSQEISILSAQGGDGCDNWGSFLKGEKYLVYAEPTQEVGLAVLSGCNRTALIIEYERRNNRPFTLTGIIDPLQDLKELEGKGSFTFNFSYRGNKQQ